MTPTKDQQAQEYGISRLQERLGRRVTSTRNYINRQMFNFEDMEQAYFDGYTACEQSMWIKVDADNPQTLPKVDQTVLCCLSSEEFIVARFDHIESHELNGKEYNEAEWWIEDGCDSYTLGDEVIYWMPITPIPYINTEKI